MDLCIIELGETIGRGAFGEVKTAICSDGKTYAIKLLPLKTCSESINTEIRVLRSVPEHPNIIRYHEDFDLDSEYKGLLLDYCEKGSLNDYVLKQGNVLKNKDILALFLDISAGLQFLHGHNAIHRDLKTENILVTLDSSARKITCKITDFGVSTVYPMEYLQTRIYTNTTVGTYYFLAPEVTKEITDHGRLFPFAADIFSLGCICLAVITMSTIEVNKGEKRILAPYFYIKSTDARHSLGTAIDFGKDIMRMCYQRLLNFVSKEVASLIASMLCKDFEHRPNAYEVYSRMQNMELKEFLKLVEEIDSHYL